MRWLVTGGCGFIGAHLVGRLARCGHAVRVLDDLSVGALNRLPPHALWSPLVCDDGAWESGRVTAVVGDVADAEAVLQACAGVEGVVHLAASTGVLPSIERPAPDFRANTVGTFTCLDAARRQGAGTFVFASSGAAVGRATPPIPEDARCQPVSPYGASKASGEAMCSAFAQSYGLRTQILRLGNVYGPGSSHKESVVARFIRQAQQGRPLTVYGSGAQTRDFVFVEDVVDAIVLAAERGLGVYHVASGAPMTVTELLSHLLPLLHTALGRSPDVHHAPARPQEVADFYYGVSRIQGELGWRAHTPLARGLAETVRSFFITGAGTPDVDPPARSARSVRRTRGASIDTAKTRPSHG